VPVNDQNNILCHVNNLNILHRNRYKIKSDFSTLVKTKISEEWKKSLFFGFGIWDSRRTMAALLLSQISLLALLSVGMMASVSWKSEVVTVQITMISYFINIPCHFLCALLLSRASTLSCVSSLSFILSWGVWHWWVWSSFGGCFLSMIRVC
jgi:hypothetical protein